VKNSSRPWSTILGAHEIKIDIEYHEILRMFRSSYDEMKKTSIEDMRHLIRSLKPKESAVFDQISNCMVKRLLPTYIECLVNCLGIDQVNAYIQMNGN